MHIGLIYFLFLFNVVLSFFFLLSQPRPAKIDAYEFLCISSDGVHKNTCAWRGSVGGQAMFRSASCDSVSLSLL